MKSYIVLLLFVVATACNNNDSTPGKTEPNTTTSDRVHLTSAQSEATNVQLDSMRTTPLSSVLKVNGLIDVPPQNYISVCIPLGGFLKSTELLPGMIVRKGQVIATLQDEKYIELQQEYLITQSELLVAEAEYERQKNLNSDKTASDKALQKAKMDYETRQIQLSALGQKLQLINIDAKKLTPTSISNTVSIFAPINGFVSTVNVNVGKYVNPTDILFQLIDPDDIHLNLNVFEKDVDKLAIGQQVTAFNNTHPEQKYAGKIILIKKDLSNDHSVEVHCHFENKEHNLLPGMYMNAEIETTNTTAYTLPVEAIVSFEGKTYAFEKINETEFSMTELETGIEENGLIEIKNATRFVNKHFVTKGAYTLLMKLKNKSEE